MKNQPYSFSKISSCLCLSAVFLGALSYAQPSNPSVRSGSVTITPGLNQTNIQQSSGKAIVNWGGFSIPSGHTVNFQQPGAQSAILNRVTGGNPSNLLGALNANGKVYLVNPNGIVVGNGARINAGAFIASTLDVSDQDFLAGGDMTFSGSSSAGIKNLGSITASNGDVILIGYQVSNEGSISSPNGVTALGAGREIILTPSGDQRLLIQTTLDEGVGEVGAENEGVIEAVQAELKAAGGNVYDLAVNQAGIIRATGVENRNGRILLTTAGGSVVHAGDVSARNADGSGGEVLIGGDYRGENAAIANAAETRISETARIDVSADSGNAGRAIVWADEITRFEGSIEGRGGEQGGDGAFAEVSGKRVLDFRGTADLRAPNGQAGELLLDPASLTIVSPDANLDITTPNTISPDDNNVVSTLSAATLETQLGLGNVTLDTSFLPLDLSYPDGSIVVDAPVSWTSGNSLTFKSGNSILVNQNLNGAGSEINFQLGFVIDASFTGGPFTNADLIVDSAATVTASSVIVERNPDVTSAFGLNITDGPAGQVDFNGVLITDTLDLRTNQTTGDNEPGGFAGPVVIDNPANQIGSLRSTVSTGTFQDVLTVIDGQGGLTVDGTFVNNGGDITIVTPGDLTLNSGTSLETDGFDIHLAATGGSFINQAGAGAVNPTNGGRFLIYSDDPANVNKDGLVGNPVYNKTWAANAPGTLTQTGNRFVYSLAPTLTLTANNASKVAGEANPTFTFTATGLVGGDNEAQVFSGTPALSTTATVASPDGTYAISIALGGVTLSDFDYAINLVNGLLTVDPAALPQLIIAIQNAIRQYGENNPTFMVTYSGFQGTDNEQMVTGLQITTTANEQSPVSNYAVVPSGATAFGYEIAYQNGTLTVEPRDITLRAEDLSKTYGDALPAFQTSFENLPSFASGADVGTVTVTSGASPTTANAGTYPIIPSVTANPNYNVTPANGLATVNKRNATITAPMLSREYGLSNPTFVAQGGNFISGEFDNSSLTFTTAAVQASDVNIYPLSASGHDDTNYNINYLPGEVNVTPAPLNFGVQSTSREYGVANLPFNVEFTGSYRLGQDIDDVLDTNRSFVTTATQSSNVGNYAVTYDAAVINSNYDVSFPPGNLQITKAPLLVVPTLSNRFYGDPNPDFTLSAPGLRNGDTVSVITQESFQVFAGPASNVGNYPVQILAATAQNYTLSFNPGTMNVLARPITVRADDKIREYGNANPTFTATVSNLPDNASVLDVPQFTLSTSATQTSNVLPGGYGILVNPGSNPNYVLTPESGILDITPAPLDVFVFDATRNYASPNPAFSAVAGAGLKGIDTEAQLFLSFNTTAVPQSDVGAYPITATAATPNYSVNVVPGKLSITPAQLAVLGTPFSRSYGDPLPSDYNLNVGGLQFGALPEDVIQVFDPTTVQTLAGLYSYDVASIDPNYEIASLSGNDFRVLLRPISLRVNNEARYYGDDNPGFSFESIGAKGFTEFDNPGNFFTLLTPVNTSRRSAPGYYLISAIPNENVIGRYDIESLVPGVLTVAPRPITISVNDASQNYPQGTALNDITDFSGIDFTATASNLANGGIFGLAYPGIGFQVLSPGDTYQVRVQRPLNQLSPPPVSDFGTTDLAESAQTRDFIPFNRFGTSLVDIRTVGTPSGNLFASFRNGRVLSVVAVNVVDQNDNYVINNINLGTLTLTNAFPEPETIALEDMNDLEITKRENEFKQKKVRTNVDYEGNLGLVFYDYPDMTLNMVMRYLNQLFNSDQLYGDVNTLSLFEMIFGDSEIIPPDFDESMIRAWLADIDTNIEKRMALGGALVEYLKHLQMMNPENYSPGEKQLADAVAAKVLADRKAFADELLERKQNFDEFPVASEQLYRARTELKVRENRAAIAAKAFRGENTGNLSYQENVLLEQMMGSIIDGDQTSSIAFFEEWIRIREDVEPKTFFDGQVSGFLNEMSNLISNYDEAAAAIASGSDLYKEYTVIDQVSGESTPYGEFLKETTFTGLEAKMQRYDVTTGTAKVLSSVGGATAGGFMTGGVIAIPALKAAILPNLARGGGKATVAVKATVGASGAGVLVIAAAFTASATVGIIVEVQKGEQKMIFDDLVVAGTESEQLTLAGIDFKPQVEMVSKDVKAKDLADQLLKEMLVGSLEEMLLGM